ncbi:MAG: peptidase [Candidatus Tectomicrobia bacterium]|uniref:Peptidase n=1 Tax=Tectimicrobiota bacterium TaxID=2528274 RepID=A0A932HZ21_UNCTE|nr:peptidase [Candidatus Tectomicrobia bacterium]
MGLLFVFVDGLGLAPPGPVNPLSRLAGGPLATLGGGRPAGEGFRLLPADACLGVPGVPQSATGGTALFTGVNAPAHVGGHLQGLPTRALREIIARHGLLRRARERGARVDFANAYTPAYFARGPNRRRSVTTVMMEASGLPLKRLGDLHRGEAVYRDFTNRLLREQGFEADVLAPEEAGGRLGALARRWDLLVYEHFQTDHAGHRGTMEDAVRVLDELNRFLGAALDALDPERDGFLLSSDHGNIEDMSCTAHTTHPVPILLWGRAVASWSRGGNLSLCDVTPGVLSLLDGQ